MWTCRRCGKPVYFGKLAHYIFIWNSVIISFLLPYGYFNKSMLFLFVAERRQSIGFDWHRECLKCNECGKVLNPGQHAEVSLDKNVLWYMILWAYWITFIKTSYIFSFQHKETPYCHVPCYSALFGPKLFGHGSQVESHQSFGKRYGLCDYLLKIFQINKIGQVFHFGEIF